ncbi:hypothetical protein D5S18_33140 [Nocardia panacis]|uniref:ATP synthase subunit I n=1 Tax=Nocardia panacis TaxID=2340916 RepID=A0A3A4JYJ4_9NOCA|nr:hypothetical protein [Nocardia panacis]RJO68273.1 hypothetical protein D5S18_33140 [Nocardia panacis]
MSINVDRRPIIACAAAGLVVLAVAGGLDRILLGTFVCVGLALGLVNAWLTRIGVARATGSGTGYLAALSNLRLLVVTVVALAVGVLARPDGLGILFGLMAFQLAAAAWTTASRATG